MGRVRAVCSSGRSQLKLCGQGLELCVAVQAVHSARLPRPTATAGMPRPPHGAAL